MQAHTRAIIRDGRQAFIGSQSLRKQELDARREAGIIFRDSKVVNRLLATFEGDWAASELAQNRPPKDGELASPAIFIKRAVKEAVKEVVAEIKTEVDEIITEREDVKEAVKEAIKDAVQKTDSDECDYGLGAVCLNNSVSGH